MQRIACFRSGVNTAVRCLRSSNVYPALTESCQKRNFWTSSDDDTNETRKYALIAATVAGAGLAGALAYYKLRGSTPKDGKGSSRTSGKESSLAEETKSLTKLPDRIPYLIIGAGTAAFSAARSIRAREPTAKVVIIGEEPYRPYMRPPLSKELWLTPASGNESTPPIEEPAFLQWNGKPRSVFLERPPFFVDLESLPSRENGGIAVGTGLRVVSLNPRRQSVVIMPASAPVDSQEAPRREIFYDRCLIATGGKPRVQPQLEYLLPSGKVSLYRNIDDYKQLSQTADRLAQEGGNQAIVVVGGSYLGCELAFALAWRSYQKNGAFTVYQIIRERGVLEHVLPAYLSSWTGERLAEVGVKIISGAEVDKCDKLRDGVKLKLSNGQEINAAHVVLATGIEPNTQLAEAAGLEIDESIGGIAVNSELMARNNLWAAGDVSSFYDPRLRARRRVEHHDQAIVSGRLAGENMAGAAKVYSQQAMLWSDLGPSISFEAVGIVDSRLQTYAVFAKPTEPVTGEKPEEFKRGVIFYLSTPKQGDDRRLVGMMLWNLPGRLGLARRLLKDQPSLADIDGGVAKLTEMARIMQINEDDNELADLPEEKEDEEAGAEKAKSETKKTTETGENAQPEKKEEAPK